MLIWDIETDGLLDTVSKLWCLSIYDTETDKLDSYSPADVTKGVERLSEALQQDIPICGHNIINFDIPALEKLYSWFKVPFNKHYLVHDTLVMARLIYSNIDTIDLGLMKSNKLPKKLYKSHSLKAWGYRLGELKGEYGEQEDAWAVYVPEMLEYNKQDVRVTYELWKKLNACKYSDKALILEHQVAWLMAKQERNGFPFDMEKALELEKTLRCRQAQLEAQLVKQVPRIPDKIFIPKRDNKRLGYKKGVPIQRYKDFNPNSRKQIEYVVREYFKYSPNNTDLYDIPDGATENINLKDYRLKVDDETFKFIKKDESAPAELRQLAEVMEESLLVSKRLGQLADGKNAWLLMYNKDTGCIHGRVIPNGAVSGRATHSNPNVAQVPSVSSPYGKECRELFNSNKQGNGWWQAGIDASGLELRCLAHYLAPYDNGEYAHEILNGDIHTKNQLAAGLPTRNQAKTFIYCFLLQHRGIKRH